jgi:hypothetical protein
MFPSQGKVKITEAGQPCRHCKTPVVRRSHTRTPTAKGRAYYFEYWFQCPSCRTLYMVEAAKRFYHDASSSGASLIGLFEDEPVLDPVESTSDVEVEESEDDGLPPWD